MTARNVNGISPIEDRLETGLLNLWYLVADASWITQEPVGLKRLDQDIVLWRNENGEINVVEDRCPHRGARLSKGRVHRGRITCSYHGVQLNGEGVITETPATPDCPLVGKRLSGATRVVSSRVQYGYILGMNTIRIQMK